MVAAAGASASGAVTAGSATGALARGRRGRRFSVVDSRVEGSGVGWSVIGSPRG